jgi:hypothetical protein
MVAAVHTAWKRVVGWMRLYHEPCTSWIQDSPARPLLSLCYCLNDAIWYGRRCQLNTIGNAPFATITSKLSETMMKRRLLAPQLQPSRAMHCV